MDRLFFENIRCFTTRQDVPLAPLTILVGENSSGKSTFLALVRLAWDLAQGWRPLDFNEEPFLLGAFAQIVGRGGNRFHIGMDLKIDEPTATWAVSGIFEADHGIPALRLWEMGSPPSNFVIDPSVPFYSERRVEGLSTSPAQLGIDLLLGKKPFQIEEGQQLLAKLQRVNHLLGPRPYSFAPVRTKPRRTYDPIGVGNSPEGSHIPMILASLPWKEAAPGKALFEALHAFGQISGLFEKVEARHLGEGEGDPFQVQVHIGGSSVNLIDVGYGVSQALPIVVDCLRGEERGTFLLQQPEVHLHPRAQAELGSFLGVLAKQQNKRFVIETHSDHLVDRIRMDIRDGKGLKPEDVSLLYFERTNGQANIHRLALDEHGNLLDPPAGYRRFFLEEERRFLGG